MSELPMTRAEWRRSAVRVLAAAALLLLVGVACSVGEIVTGRAPGPAATATKTPRPTFTPLPGALTPAGAAQAAIRGTLPPGVTAAAPVASAAQTPGAAGGVTHLVIYATNTPLVVATATPSATRTPRPETPRPQVTPIAVIQSDTLNGRRGPGTGYERIGQAAKGAELQVLGKTADGTWLQVCCMANQPVWVSAELVEVRHGEAIVVVTPPPLPAPTVAPPQAPRPTVTPAPTRGLPFDIARGPEFPIKRDNGILTIWVKVYEGPADNQSPLGGYILKVKRDGADVSDNSVSFGNERPFDKTSAREGAYSYNLKFELNDAGEADWEIFLARPGGFPVSPVSKFTTKGDSYRNLVVFIAYFLAR